MTTPRNDDMLIGGHYRILRAIQAGHGDGLQHVGEPGRCRYCGCTDRAKFRSVAHTFPEALGNRWIVSDDECDDCNRLFSVYDDALASALRPFLTLGGTGGKNGVPQTGRSSGNSVIRHGRSDGRRQIIVRLTGKSLDDHVAMSPDGRHLRFDIPVEGISFRPRLAYKALSKIGLSLLPLDLLPQYSRLLAWLRIPEDDQDFPVLEVGLSFGSIGNAPPVVGAYLLQRTSAADAVPHLLLVFCAGSVCVQLALMSDHLEDHLPPTTMGSVSVNWAVVLGPNREVRIDYGRVWPHNWTQQATQPQPVASFTVDVDTVSRVAQFTPRLRSALDADT